MSTNLVFLTLVELWEDFTHIQRISGIREGKKEERKKNEKDNPC